MHVTVDELGKLKILLSFFEQTRDSFARNLGTASHYFPTNTKHRRIPAFICKEKSFCSSAEINVTGSSVLD